MKEINIAYLYYDILNLYGENGNIKVLKKHIEEQNIKVNIHFLTIKDKIEFNKYDLCYVGAGTEDNLKIVLQNIKKYKKELAAYIESNKFFVATGNALNMFGSYMLEGKNTIIETLNILDYYVVEEDFRMIDESILESNFIREPLIGFQNQNTTLSNNKNVMFKVIKGIGSYPNSKTEGVNYKNFYGTYLLGPLFARNPKFTEFFIKKLINNKYKDFKFKKFNLKLDIEAYKKFINNFYFNIIK